MGFEPKIENEMQIFKTGTCFYNKQSEIWIPSNPMRIKRKL